MLFSCKLSILSRYKDKVDSMNFSTDDKVFKCRIEEVHSGDDFVGVVDLGVDGLMKKTRLRLHGVDAPNAYRSGPNTEAGRIRDEVKRLLLGVSTLIRVIRIGSGGWVVEVFIEQTNGEPLLNVNKFLQARGYTYPAAK